MDGEILEGATRKTPPFTPSTSFSGAAPMGRLVAAALPTVRPGMLVRRRRRVAAPYPLDEPGTRYFYFARNGIYALARLWSLSGKEVLFPAYFHGVELEALLEAGVRPRFYPVGERMQVDPDEVIRRIGPETAAVYLIHYLGFPGPAEELAKACNERKVYLIEDCALALLSKKGERPLGSFGDAGIFCLYKTLPTPNGGAVVLRGGPLGLPEGLRPPFASTIAPIASSLLQGLELRAGVAGQLLRRVARGLGRSASDSMGAERIPTGTQHFDRTHLGLAMSELSRVVIEAQDFDEIVERRRRNFFHLLGRLRGLAPPIFGELPPGVCPLFYPLQVKDKQRVLDGLRAEGIEAIDFWGVSHPSIAPGKFPEVDTLRSSIVEIPCHQDLDPTTIDRMAAIVVGVLEKER